MTERATSTPADPSSPDAPNPADAAPARETPRLILRPHRSEDAPALAAICGRPEVARFLLDEPWTEEFAATQVAERLPKTSLSGPAGALAVVIEHEGRVIGDAQLWLTDRERGVAEIGWVLDPAFGGKGFAGEAAAHLLALGFVEHGLHRIAAQMDARNTASARLAERLGMTREAHLRQDWWSKGEWTDTVIFGMLASDLPEPQAEEPAHR
ncbi:GNAT family N-acetyltransferase [Leucobacter sp. M11]|uniref:GNAT family N-acetyltransferase n=1 Tax=Leucobacter sp. M11 TaxID=2993565 RepID=UPI002D8087A7|nr:GNAT family protein [Leucobacter sp. M11]MEB4614798.1 GNAT family protein [Leucobacter sp. M11]